MVAHTRITVIVYIYVCVWRIYKGKYPLLIIKFAPQLFLNFLVPNTVIVIAKGKPPRVHKLFKSLKQTIY